MEEDAIRHNNKSYLARVGRRGQLITSKGNPNVVLMKHAPPKKLKTPFCTSTFDDYDLPAGEPPRYLTISPHCTFWVMDAFSTLAVGFQVSLIQDGDFHPTSCIPSPPSSPCTYSMPCYPCPCTSMENTWRARNDAVDDNNPAPGRNDITARNYYESDSENMMSSDTDDEEPELDATFG